MLVYLIYPIKRDSQRPVSYQNNVRMIETNTRIKILFEDLTPYKNHDRFQLLLMFRELSTELTVLFAYKGYNNEKVIKIIDLTFTWQQMVSHNGALNTQHKYVSIRVKQDFPNPNNVIYHTWNKGCFQQRWMTNSGTLHLRGDDYSKKYRSIWNLLTAVKLWSDNVTFVRLPTYRKLMVDINTHNGVRSVYIHTRNLNIYVDYTLQYQPVRVTHCVDKHEIITLKPHHEPCVFLYFSAGIFIFHY